MERPHLILISSNKVYMTALLSRPPPTAAAAYMAASLIDMNKNKRQTVSHIDDVAI